MSTDPSGIASAIKHRENRDLLGFVKIEALVQITASRSGDSDHDFRRLGSQSLIESQSKSSSRPSSAAFLRSSSKSLCHCGTGTRSACARRSSQIASIIWSFSASGSCMTSAMLITPLRYTARLPVTTSSTNAQHQRREPAAPGVRLDSVNLCLKGN